LIHLFVFSKLFALIYCRYVEKCSLLEKNLGEMKAALVLSEETSEKLTAELKKQKSQAEAAQMSAAEFEQKFTDIEMQWNSEKYHELISKVKEVDAASESYVPLHESFNNVNEMLQQQMNREEDNGVEKQQLETMLKDLKQKV
jgi:tRNA nucleotidyltransferase/poly(A) polymerase